jgi:dTMP kinase
MLRPFITFDGGEGVGKTTQRLLLEERLPALYPNVEFHFTREPGGSPFAEYLRSVIFSDEAKHAGGDAMFGLFAAARKDHLRNTIIPALAAGKCVVSDRFVAATFAYQVCAMEHPLSVAEFQTHHAGLAAKPDLTVILSMDAGRALERVRQRSGEVTHFDERSLEFHERLREGYAQYASLYPETTHTVNADQDPESVHQEIMLTIREVLGTRLS